MTDLDPTAIRIALTAHRKKGTPWAKAWLDATGHSTDTDERHVRAFMEKHFRAAYYNTDDQAGRCLVPERDVSAALRAVSADPVPSNRERCRSGDECDRIATRGRHGVYWCDHHGAELERLGVKLRLDLARADPRNGGNKSLYSHKAA